VIETNKMREQFEDALAKQYDDAGFDEPSLRLVEGRYFDPLVQSAWWGWQNSREAVLVEMPVNVSVGQYSVALEDFKRCIEAQCLKVAP